MKRTDIKAGVVYAENSAYGGPSPVVFLQDGGSGLFQRVPHGGGIVDVSGKKYMKAHQGQGYSGYSVGYAAVERSRYGDFTELPYEARVDALYALDVAAELERFKAGEKPLAAGIEFRIVTSLNKIKGEYRETKNSYEAAEAAARIARQQKDAAAQARRDRTQLAARTLAKAATLAASEEGHGLPEGFSIRTGDRPDLVVMSTRDAEVLAVLLAHLQEQLAGQTGRYIS